MLTNSNTDSKISDAQNNMLLTLAKYEYKEPSIDQLAEHMGFNTDEQRMLKLFWEPAFNNNWIYLSPTMITKDMGYKQISYFYKDTLYMKYIEDIDYKEIKKNDVLVKLYDEYQHNTNGDKSPLGKKIHTGGKAQKYYAITGKTLKKMLMKCGTKKGDQICDYYLKVEQLSIFMKDYNVALHTYILQKQMDDQKKIIDDQKEQLDIKDNRSELLKSFAEHIQTHEFNSYFYIATSKAYAKKNYFKLGITTNLECRLRQYNCERPEDDMFYYAYFHECYEASQIEKRTKFLLNNFQRKNNLKKEKDETYFMHYTKLKKIVELVCNNYTSEIEDLNKIVATFKDSFMEEQIIPKALNIPIKQSLITLVETKDNVEIKREVIDVANLSAIQKKEKLIQAIGLFVSDNNIKENFDYETEKDTELNAILVWKDIVQNLMKLCSLNKTKVKPSLWKDSMTGIINESKCIKQVKWR